MAVGKQQLVVMGRAQFSPAYEPVHFILYIAGPGVIQEAVPDEIAFVTPGFQLLPDAGREMPEGGFGGGQLLRMSCIQPCPGGFVRKILAGNGGDHGLMDVIFPVSSLIMRQASVMDEVVCPVEELISFERISQAAVLLKWMAILILLCPDFRG
jgi:hypothetical protein